MNDLCRGLAMKDIYIAFLASNYKSGKFIRAFTRTRYSHVALSSSPQLSEMYSFSRQYYNTPFVAGFVRELPSRYLYNGTDTPVKVCKVSVSDAHYEQILSTIHTFMKNKKQMRYNFLSAFAYPLHKSVKIRDAYICIEFVRFVLGIHDFLTIPQLEKRLSGSVVYEGGMRALANTSSDMDDYFDRKSFFYQLSHTTADLALLIRRLPTK